MELEKSKNVLMEPEVPRDDVAFSEGKAMSYERNEGRKHQLNEDIQSHLTIYLIVAALLRG